MKLMIDGMWRGDVASAASRRSRPIETGSFRGRITADGSSGFPAEPGRYHLYASYACPFAHRIIIGRVLKRLENIVGLSVLHPTWNTQESRARALQANTSVVSSALSWLQLLKEWSLRQTRRGSVAERMKEAVDMQWVPPTLRLSQSGGWPPKHSGLMRTPNGAEQRPFHDDEFLSRGGSQEIVDSAEFGAPA